jgi:hypothetical protein
VPIVIIFSRFINHNNNISTSVCQEVASPKPPQATTVKYSNVMEGVGEASKSPSHPPQSAAGKHPSVVEESCSGRVPEL